MQQAQSLALAAGSRHLSLDGSPLQGQENPAKTRIKITLLCASLSHCLPRVSRDASCTSRNRSCFLLCPLNR